VRPWLDEIVKGLATGDEDDGLSRRVLGSLVIWMSERRSRSSWWLPLTILPSASELVRKGRFDEIFSWTCRGRKIAGHPDDPFAQTFPSNPGFRYGGADESDRRLPQVRKSSKRLCRRCTPPTPRDGMFPRRICWLKFNNPPAFSADG